MNFGFSGEMIFLFLLALILFGPKKMPEIGRQVARILNEFRRASYEFRSQIESEVNSIEVSGKVGKAGGNRGQQMLPSFQAPLGSLANRIFNPPSAEKKEAVENAAAENAAAAEAAVEAELTSSPEAASAARVESARVEAAQAGAAKVAPDA